MNPSSTANAVAVHQHVPRDPTHTRGLKLVTYQVLRSYCRKEAFIRVGEDELSFIVDNEFASISRFV